MANKEIKEINFSGLARYHYIIEKPIDQDVDLTTTKHEVNKTIGNLDTKIHNAFLVFYYSLMTGDSNSFYQAIGHLSKTMSNHTASNVTNHPMIRATSISLTPHKFW